MFAIARSLGMPYVQASPRVRAGYAAPLFSAFAFVVAAGLALDGSPFRDGIRDEVTRATTPTPPRIVDPMLAGAYDTVWGRVTLHADGRAQVAGVRGFHVEPALINASWHVADGTITVEWPTGSFAAAREWWQLAPSAAAPPDGTCVGGSC